MKIDGIEFRDLDHDGVLSPYEDHRLTPEERANDLVGRMSLPELAGVMFHGTTRSNGPLGVLGAGTEYDEAATAGLVGRGINHLITRLQAEPREFARQNNRLQQLAADSRWGIPLTISTDPRHHFQHVTGASTRAVGFSEWPETTGLAAIGSAELMHMFADIVRQEYRAVGIHVALSPQADIATEPRWPRFSGTFGEDPALARRMVDAYVEGIQGGREGVTGSGVAAVVKHWVGYGAAPDGFDGHNDYGRYSSMTAESLVHHVEPFLGAFDAGVAGVMPTYTILRELTLAGDLPESVAGGFSHNLIEGLLRETHCFNGFVLSDWAIYRDPTETTFDPQQPQQPGDIATCWGVEDLPRVERMALSINAGVDQMGGEEDVDVLLEAVRLGLVTEDRVRQAAYRLLLVKFQQGLFEQPFVDEDAAAAVVGSEAHRAAGRDAQQRSVVWLKRPSTGSVGMAGGDNVVVLDARSGLTSASLPPVTGQNERVLLRLSTPCETLHPNHFFGRRQAEGDIDFKAEAVAAVAELAARGPVIAAVEMTRPAILTDIIEYLDGVVVDLGASESALLAAISDGTPTEARLPFELPSSMEAVSASRSDLPGTDAPLFPRGFRAADP